MCVVGFFVVPALGRCQLPGTYLASSANCADRFVRIWNWAKRNDCLHVLKPQAEIELEGHEEKVVLGPTKRGVRVSSIVDIGKVRVHHRVFGGCDGVGGGEGLRRGDRQRA